MAIITIFYFFRDGPQLIELVRRAISDACSHERQIFSAALRSRSLVLLNFLLPSGP
jgi:predicted PurR-regulated permease PerM